MRTVKQIEQRFSELKKKRADWEPRWQSISDHQLARGDFTAKNEKGSPSDQKIFDGTAQDAWFMLTNAIQSILADVESNWLFLGPYDTDDVTTDELNWYEVSQNILLEAYRDDEARFPTQFNETIGDICAYGTGSIHQSYDPSVGNIVFSSRPLSEIYIDDNDNGVINTIYREYTMKCDEVLMMFPDMGERSRRLVEKKGSEECPMVTSFEVSQEKQGFESITYIEGSGEALESSHYEALPIHTARWRTDPGQAYGAGPGVFADSFARTLNEVVKDWIIQAQTQVRPPYTVSDDGVISGPDLTPGASNVVSSYFPGQRPPIEVIDLGGNFQVANEEIVRLQNSIRRAYLHEILQITDQKELTAFHVQELVSRSQQWAGPVFQRLKTELIMPMVRRSMQLLIQNGKIPRPPDTIIQRGVKIRYVSPAQRAAEIQLSEATFKAIERNLALAQVAPEVLDIYDMSKIARHTHIGFSADPSVLRSDQEVRDIREQRAEAQAAEQEKQAMTESGAVAAAAGGESEVANILAGLSKQRG